MWLAAEEVQKGDIVVRSINNVMFHLDVEKHLEVNIANKVDEEPESSEDLPSQPMGRHPQHN